MKPLADQRAFRIRRIIPVLAAALPLCAAGCAAVTCPETPPPPAAATAEALKERWGIEVVALRRSVGGNMLDFRYRVTDAEKARPILDRKAKAYLIDQASGRRLGVPDTPKVGPLRQTSRQPIAGRTYFIIFGNPGRLMKAGDRATVVIGDFRADDLVVE
jgi:hypothetical protein